MRKYQLNHRVAGVERYRPPESSFSSWPVPLERPIHVSEGVLGLRKVRVGGHGSNCRLANARGDEPRVGVTVERARAVCHGKVRPRE